MGMLIARRRAAPRQPHRDPRRAPPARTRAARGGRAVAGARPAVPARAVRRAAPAGGAGAGARPQPRGDHRRRGGQRARRVDPGADHQPAAAASARTGAVLSVHRPRPRGGPPPEPPRGRYVSRADRGAGRGGRSLYRSPASLHRVAAVGRAGARPVGRGAAGADHPARRSAEPRGAAAGVPVPHPVLAPGAAGWPRAVRGGGARPPAGFRRPHRGLPLHRRGAGEGRGVGGRPDGRAGAVSARRPEPASNRERILIEAARLFARRGYHATTTRQIAQAVGIRQPSLFHHFPSKRAIVQEILRSDLDEAVPAAEALASGPGPAGVRLYRYVRHDVEHLIGSPYDLRGMYTEEVMGDPQFAAWNQKRIRLHAAVEQIVKDGVASGVFLPIDTALAREAIAGILIRALTLYSGGRTGASARFGDEIASLVLRGLPADPAVLEAGRRDAAGGSDGG